MPSLFLTGYEEETIVEFLKKLKANNITTVIDVREIPLSRKEGFSKNELREVFEKNNINYYHFSELGSPSNIRDNLKEGNKDYLTFFKQYRNYINNRKDLFADLLNIILKNKKTSLLCYETETDLCHRTIIASEILKKTRKLKIIPL